MKVLSDPYVIRVAIQRPLYKLLDYQCRFDPTPEIGSRIKVPLGNTRVVGILIEAHVTSQFKNLKYAIEALDQKTLFDASLYNLLTWASKYYFYPLGEVLFHALPVPLRKGKQLPKKYLWEASESGLKTTIDKLSRAPKQKEMFEVLKLSELSALQLQERFGKNWYNIIKQLEQKQLVYKREVASEYFPKVINPKVLSKKKIILTSDQKECLESISKKFKEEGTLKPILLHGITGSGKTEVYLRSVEPILGAGKQVLVLVPEIGLTPQLLFRFKEHFTQYTIISLHSSLPEGERLQAWIGARTGAVDVIIGTRSAVFTPMNNLGAIIIDEEHDASFKQQEGFLYHARDMAVKRAYNDNIPVILGSATPSLESLYNVERQGYHYLRLSRRPGKSKRPEMVIQDIRSLQLEAGVSSLMMTEMRKHLALNNQVMLFLNRRGFAPVLMCQSCGWHAVCEHCDAGMTFHAKASKVVCHHCGYENIVKPVCPSCNSDQLTTQGQGTERIEAVLNNHFPETPVIRVDKDSTAKKGALEKKLKKITLGEPAILIGTQMLTKGHDFPKLTLVGILDVDQSLFSIDYRAQERLAQQILQVAGRAGRGEDSGRVILQTSQPEHPFLVNLLSSGYYEITKDILNERNLWGYPPFGKQALIRVSANSQDAGMKFLNLLRHNLDQNISNDDALILGPMVSPMLKKANRYRFQLLLTANERGKMHRVLNMILGFLLASRKIGGIRWLIDVDPLDFT